MAPTFYLITNPKSFITLSIFFKLIIFSSNSTTTVEVLNPTSKLFTPFKFPTAFSILFVHDGHVNCSKRIFLSHDFPSFFYLDFKL